MKDKREREEEGRKEREEHERKIAHLQALNKQYGVEHSWPAAIS